VLERKTEVIALFELPCCTALSQVSSVVKIYSECNQCEFAAVATCLVLCLSSHVRTIYNVAQVLKLYCRTHHLISYVFGRALLYRWLINPFPNEGVAANRVGSSKSTTSTTRDSLFSVVGTVIGLIHVIVL